MKGKLTLTILESLSSTIMDSADLLEAFLTTGYGASSGKLMREASRIRARRSVEKMRLETERRKRQAYYALLYHLKLDELIKEDRKNGKRLFSITGKGEKKLAALRERHMFPTVTYHEETAKSFLIVVFDIPERERKKRDWLRAALKNLGLHMIQRSVWLGKTKLPSQFINDIGSLNIAECVHIFEINKKGTLARIL